MVMEVPPSPDSVGREFVRQYYTLLNKAPTHLHRFYNNQSSFVHGGLDPPNRATPMIGQKQIHQKIQQLNFRDCHAKIAQVDAQATLGNGVVVQVTGELSNAGQPMRRFTQTFVLAAQSPKKYYVHNDIFRYQDEIISDEEGEGDSRSDLEDDITNQDRPTLGDMQTFNQQPIYYSPSTAPNLPGSMPPVPHHHAQPPPPHVIPTQPTPTINGAVHPEETSVMPVPQHVTPSGGTAGIGPNVTNIQPSVNQVPIPAPLSVEDSQQNLEENVQETPVENNYVEEQLAEQENTDAAQESSVSLSEPKTYATLLKSGGNSAGGFSTINSGSTLPNKTMSPPPSNRFDNREGLNLNPAGGEPVGQRTNLNRQNKIQPRMPRQDSRGTGRTSLNEGESDGIFEERRRSQGNSSFNDSNQVFLGNVPHNATDEELREIFQQFGTIVDLRIHNKPLNKSGPLGSRAPVNYGFITYDNQQSVQNCLAAKGIYYPLNDKSGTRLNVQEKKTKERQSYGGGGGMGGGRISMDSNGGPRPRDNGQRRGPGGPGGQGGRGGIMSGNGNRTSSFNRGPPNRGPNNTFSNRR